MIMKSLQVVFMYYKSPMTVLVLDDNIFGIQELWKYVIKSELWNSDLIT